MNKQAVFTGFIALFCVVALAQTPAQPTQTPATQTPPQTQTAPANPPTQPAATSGARIAVIHIQRAITDTAEGKKAAEELTKRFTPVRNELEKMQLEIESLKKKLEGLQNVGTDEQRAQLIREIDRKTKDFNRKNEDAQNDFQAAEAQLINSLGQKVMRVIDEYARRNGYDVVLDISQQNSNVLWAKPTIEITDEVIGAYNIMAPQLNAPTSSNPAAPGAAKPGGPGASTATPTKPATPPTKKTGQ
jgi:outer membrane protein